MALTSIFGNVSATLAAENALRLCELCEQSIPVAIGAAKPLTINPHPPADFVHGNNGFGNVELPSPTVKADQLSAADLIVKLINENPGEISLIAVGPLTNLALALQRAPDIANNVAEVIIMGGSFYREGNVSPFAEANIWNDPHAAQQVFHATWPITVHGLDVTRQITFSREYLDTIAKARPIPGEFLRASAEFYIEFYQSRQGLDGCCPHDQLALSYATNPDWFTIERGQLDVTIDGEQIGRTTISAGHMDNNVALKYEVSATRTTGQIATAVDRARLLQDYSDVLSGA